MSDSNIHRTLVSYALCMGKECYVTHVINTV